MGGRLSGREQHLAASKLKDGETLVHYYYKGNEL